MIPVIALVGRPNVGKSTLFNRLTKSRDALVADFAGLTRDRKYGEGRIGDRPYMLIDTGGISGDEEGIDTLMAEQSLAAIAEADAVLFLVDAQAGLTVADQMIGEHLRRTNKNCWVVGNKIDSVNPDLLESEFAELALGEAQPIAAAHGRGVRALVDKVLGSFPEEDDLSAENEADQAARAAEEQGIKIAVIGRPNVGKSTLVNRLLGEDRVVVYDYAGTTRDSIYIPYERFDKNYTLIDTAGVRRRGKIDLAVEKFSVIKSLQAIQDANVVVLVMDARQGIVEQDLHLLGFVLESGRAVVLAVNKWDGMDEAAKEAVKTEIDRRLGFINFARLHFISALHGSCVGDLYDSIEEAYDCATQRWSANQLTRLLEDAVDQHQPPLVRGHRIKLRYCHMGGSNPPLLVMHGNQVDSLPDSYKKYLQNTFRKVLKIVGTPIRLQFCSGANPFADRHNKLTERQIMRKRRMMEHAKLSKKKR